MFISAIIMIILIIKHIELDQKAYNFIRKFGAGAYLLGCSGSSKKKPDPRHFNHCQYKKELTQKRSCHSTEKNLHTCYIRITRGECIREKTLRHLLLQILLLASCHVVLLAICHILLLTSCHILQAAAEAGRCPPFLLRPLTGGHEIRYCAHRQRSAAV